MAKGNLIFVGLQGSGKSSFIAALWHVAESGEIDNSIKIEALPEERTYLNALRTKWLKCIALDRTVADFKNELSFEVSIDNGEKLKLFFPDLDGELYRGYFEDRLVESDFVERLKQASDIVLFINPDRLKKPDLIADGAGLTTPSETDATTDETVKNNPEQVNKDVVLEEEEQEVKFDPKFAPTQVVLVDLLQIFLDYIKAPKISVVVSAWDLIISASGKNVPVPKEWLRKNLPLLFQYMDTNEELLSYRVFGVSAQGGDYEEDGSNLKSKVVASQRIKVQDDSDKIQSDISLPLKWVLND